MSLTGDSVRIKIINNLSINIGNISLSSDADVSRFLISNSLRFWGIIYLTFRNLASYRVCIGRA